MNDILNFNEFNRIFSTINTLCSSKGRLKNSLASIINRDKCLKTELNYLMLEYNNKIEKLDNSDVTLYYKLKEYNLSYVHNLLKLSERKDVKKKSTKKSLRLALHNIFNIAFDYSESKTPYYYEIIKNINEYQPKFVTEDIMRSKSLKDYVALITITGAFDSYYKRMLKQELSLNGMVILWTRGSDINPMSIYPYIYAYIKGDKDSPKYPHPSTELMKLLNL